MAAATVLDDAFPAVRAARQRARVYVSSAVHGLLDARAVVIEAVRRSGCEPVCMETYGADTRPPIERCLEDVAGCEVYVGIVAWRYGSFPPGQQKSVNHLEYDQARRLRKQILLFHLEESAPWPTQHVDPSQAKIRRLRAAQARAHIVDHFSSLDQLSSGVRRALHRLYGEATTPVPALLPYVADRHDQQECLAAAVKRCELDRSPSLVLVHGRTGQAHHKFVECLQETLLARYLDLSGPIHATGVALRAADFDQPDVITRRIAGDCALDPTLDAPALARELHGLGSLTVLRLSVEVELPRGRPQVRRLAQLLDYFSRWPREEPLRVLPVVSVHHREPSGWTRRFWERPAVRQRLVAAIEAAAHASPASVLVLPELANVQQVEVEVWADRPEVRRFLGDTDAMPIIRRMFHAHERSSKERGIPMEKLAAELTHLLHHRSPWQEAA